jgi:chromosome segregation ATPase
MDITAITKAVSSVGFPIVCVIGMGWFIYQVFKKTTDESAKNMEKVQARCKEREEKLYQEIKENREVNAKAIETIAHYAEKLDTIQSDISDIKTDITILMTKN